MNRREFVSWVGVGWVAASLPIALAACSSEQKADSQTASPSSSPLPPPSATGSQATAIGTVADLDKNGMLQGKIGDQPVLVVRNPQVKDQLAAVNPTCTHKGCTVDWKADQQQFVCPCHGAAFAIDGIVTHPPAKKPLTTYNAKIEGNQVVVQS